MTFTLRNSGVVITGGGGGIGAALARRFAQCGARVVVADIDRDAATRIATEIDGLAVGEHNTDPEVIALDEQLKQTAGVLECPTALPYLVNGVSLYTNIPTLTVLVTTTPCSPAGPPTAHPSGR
jgi:NAD(P)-dependent dehydrogenase (short-subunit alcohol dehydrogenase family)